MELLNSLNFFLNFSNLVGAPVLVQHSVAKNTNVTSSQNTPTRSRSCRTARTCLPKVFGEGAGRANTHAAEPQAGELRRAPRLAAAEACRSITVTRQVMPWQCLPGVTIAAAS
jgi:hypothetical protein